jgi:hypothetical protein
VAVAIVADGDADGRGQGEEREQSWDLHFSCRCRCTLDVIVGVADLPALTDEKNQIRLAALHFHLPYLFLSRKTKALPHVACRAPISTLALTILGRSPSRFLPLAPTVNTLETEGQLIMLRCCHTLAHSLTRHG